jgi:hypothetical protein
MKIARAFVLCLMPLLIGFSFTTAECSSWQISQSRMRKAARTEAKKIDAFWKRFDGNMDRAESSVSNPGAADNVSDRYRHGIL